MYSLQTVFSSLLLHPPPVPPYGAQFPAQGFGPSVGGATPPTTMIGGGPMIGLANGSYMGMQQQQQGQWGVPQVRIYRAQVTLTVEEIQRNIEFKTKEDC